MTPNAQFRRTSYRALADLADGLSVVIVACPHDFTVSIARTICKRARLASIPCANLPECRGEGPRVSVRAYNAVLPLPTPRERVHRDLSAVFERQRAVPPPLRWVAPL